LDHELRSLRDERPPRHSYLEAAFLLRPLDYEGRVFKAKLAFQSRNRGTTLVWATDPEGEPHPGFYLKRFGRNVERGGK